MKTDAHLESADHCDELIDAAMRLLAGQLPPTPIAYVWPKRRRVLFRTADGRTGDVEVQVNFDVVSTESLANGSIAP